MESETVTNAFDWVTPVIQLATSGGFGALVWYLITKHLPKIEERHRTERQSLVSALSKKDSDNQREREQFAAALERKDDQHDKITEQFNTTLLRSTEVQLVASSRLESLEKAIEKIPHMLKEPT